MAGHRESDILAYILGVLVIAISGIAVGVASTNSAPSSDGADNPSSATMTASSATAHDEHLTPNSN